mmetsp:Transcript_55737/g.127513  ORF Transcript_55737/g.127513 Transcript_55737/m.127513 type:complete len:328 (-) Transcript_55737:478-1461(-)
MTPWAWRGWRASEARRVKAAPSLEDPASSPYGACRGSGPPSPGVSRPPSTPPKLSRRRKLSPCLTLRSWTPAFRPVSRPCRSWTPSLTPRASRTPCGWPWAYSTHTARARQTAARQTARTCPPRTPRAAAQPTHPVRTHSRAPPRAARARGGCRHPSRGGQGAPSMNVGVPRVAPAQPGGRPAPRGARGRRASAGPASPRPSRSRHRPGPAHQTETRRRRWRPKRISARGELQGAPDGKAQGWKARRAPLGGGVPSRLRPRGSALRMRARPQRRPARPWARRGSGGGPLQHAAGEAGAAGFQTPGSALPRPPRPPAPSSPPPGRRRR